MQAEILIAVISGAAGTIGAVIAWIQAIRVNRSREKIDILIEQIKSETMFALEAFKVENERRRKAFEEASQASVPIENALDQAWQDMQNVKEVITKLLSPVRYDKDIATNSLLPAALSLEEGYRRYGSTIPEVARNAWHKAKNYTGSAERLVRDQDDVELLPGSVVENFKKIHRDLTDQQITILATREGIRGALMERLLHLI